MKIQIKVTVFDDDLIGERYISMPMPAIDGKARLLLLGMSTDLLLREILDGIKPEEESNETQTL